MANANHRAPFWAPVLTARVARRTVFLLNYFNGDYYVSVNQRDLEEIDDETVSPTGVTVDYYDFDPAKDFEVVPVTSTGPVGSSPKTSSIAWSESS